MQGNTEPYLETRLAAACLFLACKVEEASVRTNDLLNAVHLTAFSSTVIKATEGSEPDAPGFSPLVGQPYYNLKQTLILDEQYLLRTISFDIVVEHPHKFLLNFAKTMDARHGLVQLSVSLLNDSIVYSNLCLSHPPAEIAAACLQLSGNILGSSVSVPSLEPRSGWSALGVDVQRLEVIAMTLLDMTLALAV
ncbi:hypothetical protein ABBQ38_003926 [Trebouxia sp. C0009 RCD-2024]